MERNRGLISRLSLVVNTVKSRAKLDASEGGLIYHIHTSGCDAPLAQYYIAQLVRTAWTLRSLAMFFEYFGCSFQEYSLMYTAAVRACPHMLIQRDHLIATYLFIKNYRRLGQEFSAYRHAASGQTGHARAQGLTVLIHAMVNTVVESQAHKLTTLEHYFGLTKEGITLDMLSDR